MPMAPNTSRHSYDVQKLLVMYAASRTINQAITIHTLP